MRKLRDTLLFKTLSFIEINNKMATKKLKISSGHFSKKLTEKWQY